MTEPGDTEGWVRAAWYLGDFADEMVRLRFRYYRLDRSRNSERAYIDDIGPIPTMEDEDILADDIENFFNLDDEHGIADSQAEPFSET